MGCKGLEIIGSERLKELEPHATGIKGLRVPETGIIDYKKVAEAYAARVREAGGDIRLSQKVLGILERRQEIVLQTSGGDYRTNYLINCCGLHSDIVAKMMKTAITLLETAMSTESFRFAASIIRSHPKDSFWCAI